jgi:hypothetical protein
VAVIWARYKYFEGTGDRAVLKQLKAAIDAFLAERAINEEQAGRTTSLNCALMVDLMESESLDEEYREKAERICLEMRVEIYPYSEAFAAREVEEEQVGEAEVATLNRINERLAILGIEAAAKVTPVQAYDLNFGAYFRRELETFLDLETVGRESRLFRLLLLDEILGWYAAHYREVSGDEFCLLMTAVEMMGEEGVVDWREETKRELWGVLKDKESGVGCDFANYYRAGEVAAEVMVERLGSEVQELVVMAEEGREVDTAQVTEAALRVGLLAHYGGKGGGQ